MADQPAPAPCSRCGQTHRAAFKHSRPCTAHTRRDGELRPCRKSASVGLKVCNSHGGAPARVKAAGRRQRTEEKAAAVMARFAGPIDTTATEALIETVKWTAGYVAWLRARVQETVDAAADPAELVWGLAQSKTGGEDWGTTHKAGENPWSALLGQWQDRLVRTCAEAIKAGIEERRVRLAEQQGALVADVIRSILADLDLAPEQAARVGEIVPRHLRLLTA